MAFPKWLTKITGIIGKITDLLVAGRKAGLWSKEDGVQVHPLLGTTDTVHFGMPEWLASGWSLFLTLFLEYLQTTNISDLWTNPKVFAAGLLHFIIIRSAMQVKKPGQATIQLGTNTEVKAQIGS